MAVDGKRSWLKALISTEGFHKPCLKCASLKKPSRDVSVHFFDLETQKGLCGTCCVEAIVKGHRLLQIRRSSYHDVVKHADIAKLADMVGVQTYVINSSKVLFIRCRPQTRAPKCPTGASQCLICERQLADTNMRYCSIACKDSAADLSPLEEWHLATSSSHSNGSSSHLTTPTLLESSATRQGSNSSTTSVECCSNRPLKRRKKCRNPQRAHME